MAGSTRRKLRQLWFQIHRWLPDFSGRLHHQGGFWIAIPLPVLSFIGAWISFSAFFGPLAGDPPGLMWLNRRRPRTSSRRRWATAR